MSIKNARAKGNQRELKSMELAEAAGFKCTRSSRSLGCWDVIGISGSGFILIQVKSNRPPGPEEMQQLREFEAPANARKLIHVWHPRARRPEVREV